MSVSTRHVLEQGPVLRSLAQTAFHALRGPTTTTAPAVPGPWIEDHLPPRSEGLLRDYVRHVGGDPSFYKGRVPPSLFPQWTFGLGSRILGDLPYKLTKALNAGARIELVAPLPQNEPLIVRGRLERIDDNGQRVILTQRMTTGTARVPEAIVTETRAIIPLAAMSKKDGAKNGAPKAPKARPTVPEDAREIAFMKIPSDAGLDFAKLTGDFNPIHWVPAYARASGFKSCILHGFSTVARSIEALNRAVFAGDAQRLAFIDVRFSRPVVLPAKVGVYVASGNRVFVGDAPGGGAYMEGTFGERGSSKVEG